MNEKKYRFCWIKVTRDPRMLAPPPMGEGDLQPTRVSLNRLLEQFKAVALAGRPNLVESRPPNSPSPSTSPPPRGEGASSEPAFSSVGNSGRAVESVAAAPSAALSANADASAGVDARSPAGAVSPVPAPAPAPVWWLDTVYDGVRSSHTHVEIHEIQGSRDDAIAWLITPEGQTWYSDSLTYFLICAEVD